VAVKSAERLGGGNNSIYTDEATETVSKKQLENDIVSSGARAENTRYPRTPILGHPFSATGPAAGKRKKEWGVVKC
jgi:hypothetical protein